MVPVKLKHNLEAVCAGQKKEESKVEMASLNPHSAGIYFRTRRGFCQKFLGWCGRLPQTQKRSLSTCSPMQGKVDPGNQKRRRVEAKGSNDKAAGGQEELILLLSPHPLFHIVHLWNYSSSSCTPDEF